MEWSDVSISWLYQYLITKYPEMKFKQVRHTTDKYDLPDEAVSDINKKVSISFNVNIISEDKWETDPFWRQIWKSPKLVHLQYENNLDSYSGCGWAVDNFDDLYSGIDSMVKKVKEAIGYKDQPRQLSIFDMIGEM